MFGFIAKENGGYNDGDPPLPIPNREVKPISADDTAIPSGKVGSRQLIETFSQKCLEVFFLPMLPCCRKWVFLQWFFVLSLSFQC